MNEYNMEKTFICNYIVFKDSTESKVVFFLKESLLMFYNNKCEFFFLLFYNK